MKSPENFRQIELIHPEISFLKGIKYMFFWNFTHKVPEEFLKHSEFQIVAKVALK